MSDILACADCEDVPSEVIDKAFTAITSMTEGNDVKHSWIGLNSYFVASPKYALTFLIVDESISASTRVHFIANLRDRWGVDTIFNGGVYMWVLK